MCDAWKPWIDMLCAPGTDGKSVVENAAICGFTAGQESVWSSTPGLCNVLAAEIKKLACDRKDFPIQGAFICGQKCRLLRDQMEEDQVFTCDMRTAADADGNTFNVCVGKSLQAIVIAIGKKDVGGGQLRPKVYSVVENLRKAGM